VVEDIVQKDTTPHDPNVDERLYSIRSEKSIMRAGPWK